MSKSYNQTNNNRVLMNSYSKKMFNFYKPLLKLLTKESHIAQSFSIKNNSTMRNFLTYIYLQFIEVSKFINTLNITNSRR